MIGRKVLRIAAADALFAVFHGKMRTVISLLSVEGGPRRGGIFVGGWINLVGHDGVGRMKTL